MTTSLSCGIVGLPNVGKSTFFNALTANQNAEASNFPFCTIDPNKGMVEVPDLRLEELSAIYSSEKIVPALTEVVDIAGLVKGASEGEGLGNKFLSNIRDTDAIIHVVRCFEDPNVIHVDGKIDPISDIEVINLELALADIQNIEKILQKVEKQARLDKDLQQTAEVLKKLNAHLEEGKPIRSYSLTEKEKDLLRPYRFLTSKPVLYLANVSEEDLPEMENKYVAQVREFAEKEGSFVLPICAKLEAEIAELPLEERGEFLESAGLTEPGLFRVIRASFDMLGLITFLTAGEKETRAWTIRKGSTAQEAAGRIHTDIQKGFIRAEVVKFNDMITYKGRVAAREAGKAPTQGKEYIVEDGDVILFFHN